MARTPTPENLAFISDPGQPWQVRIDQLRRTLENECSELELRHLYRLLEGGPPKGELPEHWYIIANDIMTCLYYHESDPERYSRNLIQLLNSPSQPLVLRDYTVQHLASWLDLRPSETNGSRVPPPSAEITSQVLQAMVAATTDRDLEQTRIPGTTLMMLITLSRAPGSVDCSQAISALTPWLTRALHEGAMLDNSVRVSAIQAAGILLPERFRPVIRKIAYSENSLPSLRLPAIAALGLCGEEKDVEMLREIIASRPEFSYAAGDASSLLAGRVSKSTDTSSKK